ncbi:MBL fold metallo-hydrolase [Paenibacillus sp. IB182496]|uniref:MBL fold metallo-hydrolase n=1 Tax=Paenibacillus sabuli TaxID=2772509 RepID=A0A927GTI3_9BACL|nr:MBL fold metallo-hydrolase [Paenibacillus sabuli]MBD2847608.1 MBL fold metallo-hydrolase [Paenibacillus sabuli]
MSARRIVPLGLQLLAAGSCSHPAFVTIRGGSLRKTDYPAGLALIRHPEHGWLLFDTGYSARFAALTAALPYALYRWLTPVRLREADTALRQLARLGIGPTEIGTVIVSHFHADHIGALRDFPLARILYPQAAYEAVRRLGPVRATRAGFLRGLLPERFERAALPIERCPEAALPPGAPTATGRDLLGDGSLIAVPLPGHAAGQIGLLLTTTEGRRCLLCADAAWSSRALREDRPPHPAAGLIMDDRAAYRRTFRALQRWQTVDPELVIVPSHCPDYYDPTCKEVRRL